MTPQDLCFASAGEIARLVTAGEVTARAVVEAHLDRIRTAGRALNAFTAILGEQALGDADRIDAGVRRGRPAGVLAGVPVAVKDLVDVAGVTTTAGGHARFHYRPGHDAPITTRLKDAGAVIIGKTNLHEFAYGVTNVNPHFGAVKNPWDVTRIPGGSSGGSGAAVAAGLCTGAVGTDTGGSIRIPSALCGVTGIKPTYGRVPRAGIVPLAWSLDHAGPMTRTVADAALMLQVMAGHDPADAASSSAPVPPFSTLLDGGVAGLRVGVPRRFFWEELDGDVRARCDDAVRTLRSLGASVTEVEVPHAAYMSRAVAVIISVEATAFHEQRLRSDAGAYGGDVRVRLERGWFVPGTDYALAQRARALLTTEILQVFEGIDVLVTPATPSPAAPIEQDPAAAAGVSLAMSLEYVRCTNPFNLTGQPALSVPCGFTAKGLPVGLQIIGRPFDEATVLRAGHAYQQATEWHLRRPTAAG